MFQGRIYTQCGFGARSIRFADSDGGVATTTYSYKLSDLERAEMARRITAALNLTRFLTTEQIEQGMPINGPNSTLTLAKEL